MTFRFILADPPWTFRDKGSRMAPSYSGDGRAEKRYLVEPNQRIIDLAPRVIECAADDAILGLWCPNALVLDGTGTATSRAWGFEPKQLVPWVKTSKSGAPRIGGGHYFRVCTESLIIASRGRGASLRKDAGIPGVITEEVDEVFEAMWEAVYAERGAHSAKPDASYDMIERLVDGPYLELFGRRQFSDQWTVLGDEAPGAGRMKLI